MQDRENHRETGQGKCPSQVTRCVGRPKWCLCMRRRIEVVPDSCAHLRTTIAVICSQGFHKGFTTLRQRRCENYPAKNTVQILHGLHVHRLASTFYRDQPFNRTRVLIKTAHRSGEKSTAYQRATRRTSTAEPRARQIVNVSLSLAENGG